MTSNRRELQPGDRVCVFPGLRVHSPAVRIEPTEVCQVVEQPSQGKPVGSVPAVAIRRPNGETLWIDADLVGRAGR